MGVAISQWYDEKKFQMDSSNFGKQHNLVPPMSEVITRMLYTTSISVGYEINESR